MPTPTIVSTPGSANANSYATVEEATAYHDTRLHADVWADAGTSDRTKALIMATRLLDTMYDWAAFPTDAVQALQWPRNGVLAANQLEVVPAHEIPVELKNATAELARQLLVSDRTLNSDQVDLGLTSLKAGPVAMTFRETGVEPVVVPDAVRHLLPPWWGSVRGRSLGYRETVRV